MKGIIHFVDDPSRQCTGKMKFVDKRRAKQHLTRASMPGRGRLRPYRCPHCGYWHNGHKAEARTSETRYTNGSELPLGGGEGENRS